MDEERDSYKSKSRWSSSSRFPSLYSPERASRISSLGKRISLVDAMDLEMPDHKEARDSLMNMYGESRTSRANRFSDVSKNSYEYKADIEDKDMNRSSGYKVTHECSCQSDSGCNTVHCVCFLNPREICVVGQCCPECIEMKNNFLMTTRGWALQKERVPQQPYIDETILNRIKEKGIKNIHYFKQIYCNEPNIRNLIYCTCKKSQCQKKYCLCFEKGVKCGELCNCTDCENRDKDEDEDHEEQRRWERYAIYRPEAEKEQGEMDLDIDQYMEEEMQEGNFNETMEFEPPNFGEIA